MPETMTASDNASVGGRSYSTDLTVTADDRAPCSPTGTAAQAGSLTTRTSTTVGTITMTDSGHTVTTAAKVDLYWVTATGVVAGSRRNVLVGTVSTTSVPFSGGSGDNLPIATAAMIVKPVQTEGALAIAGANVVFIAMKAPTYRGTIVIRQSDGTEILAKVLAAGQSFIWSNTSGTTNPVTGVTIGNVTFSHDSLTGSQEMVCDIGYN